MNCFNCNREFGTPRDNCPFCGADMASQEIDQGKEEKISTIPSNNISEYNVSPVSKNGENIGELIPLTITRESKIMGFAVSFNVFVDGVSLGVLKNGKSLTCQVGQGVHEVLIKCVEKDVKQTITVLRSNHSVDIITYAKIGLLAAVAEIKDIIYK